MPYQSISPLWHRYRQRNYLGNRSEEDVDPIASYRKDVSGWARTRKSRMHEHCHSLLKVVANPRMLAIAIDDIGRRTILGEDPRVSIPNWYPWEWLREIQKQILEGSFRSGKYMKYKIPKPGKMGFRTIEVPPDETRIVTRNLSNLLQPLLDPDFYDLSMGFRPGRSPAHCLAAARSMIEQGKHHMVACDIHDAFGTVPRKRMLQILSSRLHQSPVMKLIEELLNRTRKKGIPQGLAISPICLNVYLDHLLDDWWGKNFPGTVLVRYADDLAVFCDTQESAVDCYAALRERIETIGMQIKESQGEAIFDLSSGDHVNWIGFNLRWTNGKMRVRVNESSWYRLEAKLLEWKHKRDKGEPLTDFEIASIGFQWLTQKAPGIKKTQVPSVAEQIRQLADHCGLNMTEFTDEEARIAWQT
ncbi:MAG: reverse transcriptase/maturase family protein, partial [Planctomycetota bacterium]|nr:reverse transcriptase/maturase family protein [Planctomycetota bacterium]